MSTVVFFNFPGHGHINPTLPMVTELVQRGEKVIYYSLEDFREQIEQTGALFCSYGAAYSFDHKRLDRNVFTFILQLAQTCQLMLEQILPEVEASKPDYIIYDSACTWGKHMAQILHIPAICSIVMLAINGRLAMSSLTQIVEMSGMYITTQPAVAQTHKIMAEIRTRYHVEKTGILNMLQNAGALNIVYTGAPLQPFVSSFDETYKFVGPSIVPRSFEPDFPFELLDERPLIYISLGTLFNMNRSFYRLCLEAFADFDACVVMTIGQSVAIEELGPLPKNFIVRNIVPQLKLLQRAALFISHAGINSVTEAFYNGVPLIVVPQGGDQIWTARRVAQLGAGKIFARKKSNAATLRQFAQKILNDSSFAQNSAKVGAALQQSGGYMRAADEIIAFYHQQKTLTNA